MRGGSKCRLSQYLLNNLFSRIYVDFISNGGVLGNCSRISYN